MSQIPTETPTSSPVSNQGRITPENRSLNLNSGADGDLSTTPSSPVTYGDDVINKNYNEYTPIPPRSPVLSSSDSLMDITPFSSNSQHQDDFVLYSDSDKGSQNSLRLRPYVSGNSSASETDSTKSASINKHRKKKLKTKTTPTSKSSRRESIDSTPSPKPKKHIRRKSRNSEPGSEKSIRHHHSDYPVGSGYTLAPAAGKIFRNLLILEESLRQQVIQQRALRRKYLTFLAVLCSLIASISHHLYFSNSSSNSGPVRVILQFILLALLVTLMLYHLSGEYQKTIVLPRKFLSSTNKGLRQLNVRLVKIKTPLTDNIIDLIREFLLLIATMCLDSLHKVYPSIKNNKHSRIEVFLVGCQLQCQPRIGVTDVKLVLNARVFNTDVREGWELYRSEFWIHEGVRRRNAMMAFATENYRDTDLDRSKLLKRDKKERKDRRKSTAALSERNLNKILKSDGGSLTSTPLDLSPIQSAVATGVDTTNY